MEVSTEKMGSAAVVFWQSYFKDEEEVLVEDFLGAFADYVEVKGNH
jgi:hypothetical protein